MRLKLELEHWKQIDANLPPNPRSTTELWKYTEAIIERSQTPRGTPRTLACTSAIVEATCWLQDDAIAGVGCPPGSASATPDTMILASYKITFQPQFDGEAVSIVAVVQKPALLQTTLTQT